MVRIKSHEKCKKISSLSFSLALEAASFFGFFFLLFRCCCCCWAIGIKLKLLSNKNISCAKHSYTLMGIITHKTRKPSKKALSERRVNKIKCSMNVLAALKMYETRPFLQKRNSLLPSLIHLLFFSWFTFQCLCVLDDPDPKLLR